MGSVVYKKGLENLNADDWEEAKIYLRDVRRTGPVSSEEESYLTKGFKKGDIRARDRLVTANLRFAVSMAIMYKRFGYGLSLSELISAGNLGLMNSVERFDEKKGYKFITYAVWWIRQAIQNEIRGNRSITLPSSHFDLLQEIKKIYPDLLSRGFLTWEDYEKMSEGLKASPKLVERILNSGEVSLDSPYLCDGVRTYHDIIEDINQESPDEFTDRRALSDRIELVLSDLDDREAEVARMYFGLNGEGRRTLQEIANRFGLSRERVRQIKARALLRLRGFIKCRDLEGCLREEVL